jgi:hypothetical protein
MATFFEQYTTMFPNTEKGAISGTFLWFAVKMLLFPVAGRITNSNG